MIKRRPAGERGHADHGWLDTWHTFSFGEYRDPEHMGFRSLRVINDDVVQPGRGFGKHPHRDMEIVTYVLDGALEHQDSMGNASVLRHGDVQRMSAGRGVIHSEFNHSATEPVRLLQVWLLPESTGLEPGYEEKHFPVEDKRGSLQLLVSPAGEDGALRIHQDARVYSTVLEAGESVVHELAAGRHAWVQVARGVLHLNGLELEEGDGAAVSEESVLRLEGVARAEALIFDLA